MRIVAASALLLLCTLAGAYLANSKAVLMQAVILFYDTFEIVINVIVLMVVGWKPTRTHSFGYHKAEILSSIFSIIVSWLMLAWLLSDCTKRFDVLVHGHKVPFDAVVMHATGLNNIAIHALLAMGHLSCLN